MYCPAVTSNWPRLPTGTATISTALAVLANRTNITIAEEHLAPTLQNTVCASQWNNRRGESFNPLQIYFNRNESVSDIRVQIETIDGEPIRVIRQKDIKEESAISSASFYEDQLVKKIIVTHNKYPYRIRYSYRERIHEFLTIARWQPYMDTDVPVHYSKLTVILPEDYKINIHQKNTDYTKTLGPRGKIH